MHGFLNAFVAAAFARLGWDNERLLPVLEETSVESFDFRDDSIAWRSHELGIEELRRSRIEFAISFGSCSFEEPIADLKGLALL